MQRDGGQRATLEDFWAIPEARRFHELIGGELTEKAAPSGEHGGAQAGVVAAIHPAFHRRAGGPRPGGWWIATEVEVLLNDQIVRPDVVGWRRESCPERPVGFPIRTCPDWICEVISASNPNDDTIKKLRLYQHVGVGHYWLVDPRDATLTGMKWSADGYITRLRAERTEVVRAEPFEAIELAVGTLFGDEPVD